MNAGPRNGRIRNRVRCSASSTVRSPAGSSSCTAPRMTTQGSLDGPKLHFHPAAPAPRKGRVKHAARSYPTKSSMYGRDPARLHVPDAEVSNRLRSYPREASDNDKAVQAISSEPIFEVTTTTPRAEPSRQSRPGKRLEGRGAGFAGAPTTASGCVQQPPRIPPDLPPTRARLAGAQPAALQRDLQGVGEGAHGGEPEVLPRVTRWRSARFRHRPSRSKP